MEEKVHGERQHFLGSDQAAEIQRQMHELGQRDWQLWSIGLLLMLVLGGGLLTIVFPNLDLQPLRTGTLRFEQRYLPQLFFGLISLIVLANVYLIAQKRNLNNTRRALIRELIYNERLENLSLFDPLTKLLNRRAMDEMINREVTRANRLGSSLTFMMIDLDRFGDVNREHGHMIGDELLMEMADLLRKTFRGADIVFRYGGDEFLVVMPDTNEQQSEAPMQRLLRATEQRNAASKRGFDLAFSWGVASYVTGADVTDVLRQADRRMYQKKHKLVPVF